MAVPERASEGKKWPLTGTGVDSGKGLCGCATQRHWGLSKEGKR